MSGRVEKEKVPDPRTSACFPRLDRNPAKSILSDAYRRAAEEEEEEKEMRDWDALVGEGL